MLREKASKNEVNKDRLQNNNTVLSKKDKLIPSIYQALFEKLKTLNYYQYIIFSSEGINKYCSCKIFPNE